MEKKRKIQTFKSYRGRLFEIYILFLFLGWFSVFSNYTMTNSY